MPSTQVPSAALRRPSPQTKPNSPSSDFWASTRMRKLQAARQAAGVFDMMVGEAPLHHLGEPIGCPVVVEGWKPDVLNLVAIEGDIVGSA